MSTRIRYGVIFLLALTALGSALLPSARRAAASIVFDVDPTFSDRVVAGFPHAGFQDTVVEVHAGDSLAITVIGTVCYNGTTVCLGPNGTGEPPPPEIASTFLAPDLSGGALVGKIGDGPSFFVGSQFCGVAPLSGTLFLGVNDSRVDDNTGFFRATIQLDAADCPMFFDDFDDNERDSSFWGIGQVGSGPAVAETNQRLEITIPASSTGAGFGAGFGSRCELRGDFDVQVDYELLTWPPSNGVRVALDIGLARGLGAVERVSWGTQADSPDPQREVYLTHFDADGVHGITATSDVSGKLRLARTGTTLTGYYFGAGTWTQIHSFTGVSTEDFGVAIWSWSHDYAFTNQEVRVAFDNFTVTQGELVCPPPPPETRTAPFDFVDAPGGALSCEMQASNGTGRTRISSDATTGQLNVDVRARARSGAAEGASGVGISYTAPVTGEILIEAEAQVRGFDFLSLISVPRLGVTGIASVDSSVFLLVKETGSGAETEGDADFAARLKTPGVLPGNPVDLVTYLPAETFTGDLLLNVEAGDELLICAGVRSKVVAVGLLPFVASSRAVYDFRDTKLDSITISYQ